MISQDFELRYREQTAKDCLARIKSYLDNGCAPNVVCGAYGFPCEIEDPSILAPAREDYPPFDHKQEE